MSWGGALNGRKGGGAQVSARRSGFRWRHTKAIPVGIAYAPVAEQVEDKEERDPEDAAGLNRPVGRDDDEHEGGPGQKEAGGQGGEEGVEVVKSMLPPERRSEDHTSELQS